MKITITEGTQFEDHYREITRHSIDVDPSLTIGAILIEVKKLPLYILNQPYSSKVIDHLYLMHPDTREALSAEKILTDYGVEEGGILRIMSSVR